MIKMFCDKCGKIMDVDYYKVNFRKAGISKYRDLCEECVNEVLAMIDNDVDEEQSSHITKKLFENIVFIREKDADYVLRRLKGAVSRYGRATVSFFYDLARSFETENHPKDCLDCEVFGWDDKSDLQRCYVVKTYDKRYIITLPLPYLV